MRLDTPVPHLETNPYSGKWNLHLSGDRVSAADTFAAWKRKVARALAP